MNGSTPDPHLGKALAHAPDRDVEPPLHLSAQILAAAHREAAEPAPPVPRAPLPWWRRSWGASGALATVLLAGFMGLLWRGEPPGPAVDGPAPAPVQTAEAPVPAAAPVTAPATTTATVESRPAINRKADTATLAQAARQRAEAPAKAAQAKEAERAADMQVARVAPQAAAAGKVAADSAAVVQAPLAAAPAPTPAQVSTPTPAPAPEPPPPPAPTPAVMPSPMRVAPPAVPAPTLPPVMAPAPAAAGAAAPAARAPMAETLVARPTRAVLPPLLPGDQLAWQPRSTAAVPDATWLQQLATLTRGRWLLADETLVAGASSSTALLTWQRSGAPLGVLRLESGAVWWCAAGQICLRALVPPDALRDLVGKLPGER